MLTGTLVWPRLAATPPTTAAVSPGMTETDKDGVLGEHENRHHQVHPDR